MATKLAAGTNNGDVATWDAATSSWASKGQRWTNSYPAPSHAAVELWHGGTFCGAHTDGKLWSYDLLDAGAGRLYQQDTPGGATSWKWSLPTNIRVNPCAIVVSSLSGAALAYLAAYNTVTFRTEIYSAPLVTGSTSMTWSAKLLTLAANATIQPAAFCSGSNAIFIAEYCSSDISGGPSLYRSTDGVNFTNVLQLSESFTRHFHSVYEDPFNAGTYYALVGDYYYGAGNPPHYCYKSTNGTTWTAVTGLDGGQWQAMGMGFSASHVWFASDIGDGGGPFVMDRVAQIPTWASLLNYHMLAVPGSCARTVVDAVAIQYDNTLTSDTAAFTAADVGRQVLGVIDLPDPTFILTINSGTSVELSNAPAVSSSAQTMTISDAFYATAFVGESDSASGWFYFVANDISNHFGNVAGLFLLTEPGTAPILLRTFFAPYSGGGTISKMYIVNGQAFVGRYGPINLPVKAVP